jgi:hypothetical protein
MESVDDDSFIMAVQTNFSGSPELRLYKYEVRLVAQADETRVRSQAFVVDRVATWTDRQTDRHGEADSRFSHHSSLT